MVVECLTCEESFSRTSPGGPKIKTWLSVCASTRPQLGQIRGLKLIRHHTDRVGVSAAQSDFYN